MQSKWKPPSRPWRSPCCLTGPRSRSSDELRALRLLLPTARLERGSSTEPSGWPFSACPIPGETLSVTVKAEVAGLCFIWEMGKGSHS